MARAASFTPCNMVSALEALARIDEYGNTNGLGHQIMQESQPLGRYLLAEKIDAGRVAAGPREAGDKTQMNGVFGDTEDNRNSRCCSFRRERSDDAAGRGDHGHLTADRSASNAGRRS